MFDKTEKGLFEQACGLDEEAKTLEGQAEKLFRESSQSGLTLHRVLELEAEYWALQKKIQELRRREEELLQRIEQGDVGASISRHTYSRGRFRRRFCQEGDGRFLTTGRNRKALRGQHHPIDAPEEFFHQTADSHGGKVRGGSRTKGPSYVGKGGKRIRKW